MIKNKKTNKGFILIMTLVMALVMLIICFVCLKIFLAPYVAIQTDIIKKKEFYMADTAIEVIREQISNIFYDYVDSKVSWEVEENLEALIGENTSQEYISEQMEKCDKKPYYIKNLKLSFWEDQKTLLEKIGGGINDQLGNDPESVKFIAKYSGDFFTDIGFKNTLPSSSSALGHHKPLTIRVANNINDFGIKAWGNSKWDWLPAKSKPSSENLAYDQSVMDNKVFVSSAYIQAVKIDDDIKISTTSLGSQNYYTYEDIKGSSNNKLFLPKELQKDNSHVLNTIEDQVKDHFKRRDYVIIAVSTYTGSNIKCKMRYYFSLISLSPEQGDNVSFWGSGVQANNYNDDGSIAGMGDTVSNFRPMYRFYFRKLEYEWTEED